MSALDTLTGLLDRYDVAPATVRHRLWQTIQRYEDKADEEMIVLEAQLSVKRDWLDANRSDPRYARRREKFFDEDVRLHAQYGDTLERVKQSLIGKRTA